MNDRAVGQTHGLISSLAEVDVFEALARVMPKLCPSSLRKRRWKKESGDRSASELSPEQAGTVAWV
jgi:hypothetical protein